MNRAKMNKLLGVNVLTCSRREFNDIVLPKFEHLSFRNLIDIRQSLKHSPETKWRIHKLNYVRTAISWRETTPKSKGKKWHKRKERIDDYFDN